MDDQLSLSSDDGQNVPNYPNADNSTNDNIEQVVMPPASAQAPAEGTAPGSNGNLIASTSQLDTDGLAQYSRESSRNDPNLRLFLAHRQLMAQVEEKFDFQKILRKYNNLESMNETQLTKVCKTTFKFINHFEAFMSDALVKISNYPPRHIPTYEERGDGTETDPRCLNAFYEPLIPPRQELDQNENSPEFALELESNMQREMDEPKTIAGNYPDSSEYVLNYDEILKIHQLEMEIVQNSNNFNEFIKKTRARVPPQIVGNTMNSLNTSPITGDTPIRQKLVSNFAQLNKKGAEYVQKCQKKLENLFNMLRNKEKSSITDCEAEIVDQHHAGKSMDQVEQNPFTQEQEPESLVKVNSIGQVVENLLNAVEEKELKEAESLVKVTSINQMVENGVESLYTSPITSDTQFRQSTIDEILERLISSLDIPNKESDEELQKLQIKVQNENISKSSCEDVDEIVDQIHAEESMDQVVQNLFTREKKSKSLLKINSIGQVVENLLNAVEEKELKEAKSLVKITSISQIDTQFRQSIVDEILEKLISSLDIPNKESDEELQNLQINVENVYVLGDIRKSSKFSCEAVDEIVDQIQAGESMDQVVQNLFTREKKSESLVKVNSIGQIGEDLLNAVEEKELKEAESLVKVTSTKQIVENGVESLYTSPITSDTQFRQSIVDEVLERLISSLDIPNKGSAENLQKFQIKVKNVYMMGNIQKSSNPSSEVEAVDEIVDQQQNAEESIGQVVEDLLNAVEEKELKEAEFNQVLQEPPEDMGLEMKSNKMVKKIFKDWAISGKVENIEVRQSNSDY